MADGRELPRISLTRTGIEMELSRINLSQVSGDAYDDLVSAIEDRAVRECTGSYQSHDIAYQVVDAIIDYAVAGRALPEIVTGLTKDLRTNGPR